MKFIKGQQTSTEMLMACLNCQWVWICHLTKLFKKLEISHTITVIFPVLKEVLKCVETGKWPSAKQAQKLSCICKFNSRYGGFVIFAMQ